MNMDWAFPNKRYSSSWKRHRRIFTQHINPTTIKKVIHPKQIMSIHQLLRSLLSDPSHFQRHLPLASASIMLGFAYGHEVFGPNDPLVKMVEKATAMASEGLRPKFLVNLFPSRK